MFVLWEWPMHISDNLQIQFFRKYYARDICWGFFSILTMKILIQYRVKCHIYFPCADGYDGNGHSNRFILSWNLLMQMLKVCELRAPAIIFFFNRLCIYVFFWLFFLFLSCGDVVSVVVIFRAINWGWRYFFSMETRLTHFQNQLHYSFFFFWQMFTFVWQESSKLKWIAFQMKIWNPITLLTNDIMFTLIWMFS